MDKVKIKFDRFKDRLLLTPLLCLLYYLIIFFMDNGYFSDFISGAMSGYNYLLDFICIFLLCFIFIEISVFYNRLIFRKLDIFNQYYQKMLVYSVLLFLINNVLACITSLLLNYLYPADLPGFYQGLYVFGMLITFISCIYSNTVYVEAFLQVENQKKEMEIRLSKEKKIATKARLNILKFQFNPHFMFNCFSTLIELISEDQALASKFAEHLSKVYRYVIQNLDKDVVCIKEELKFLDSYMYMMKIRYENAICIQVSPELETTTGNIPPASLQLLVENAIKHNKISEKLPLVISIYKQGEYIVVENPLQPIVSDFDSTGIGLQNVKDRYSILCDRLPVVCKTSDLFTVKLPIIKIKTFEYEHIDS